MRIIKMKGPLCLLTSTAMLLDEEPDDLAREIGYTGLETMWPELKDHKKFRGHHIQEMQQCCLRRGYALACIDADPYMTPELKIKATQVFKKPEKVFFNCIKKKKALLIGKNDRGEHACAWDGSQIYDPNGFISDGENFEIKEAWLLTRLI